MIGKKCLIVNADDFSMSPGVNRGIIKTHECGITTSASLMVRRQAAAEAASYGRRQMNFSLGIHIDLGEWVYDAGKWLPIYQRVNIYDAKAVAEEVTSQLKIFLKLVGGYPTHLDSHQHVHLREPVRSILLQLANKLKIPLRSFSHKVQYCGKFYGQTTEGFPMPGVISESSLLTILKSLPPGYTELSCHPGEANDVKTVYQTERLQEVNILCNPQFRKDLASLDIQLCSFSTIDAWLRKPHVGKGVKRFSSTPSVPV